MGNAVRNVLKFIAVAMILASPADADSTDLRSLTTRDDSRGWDAVGRLNLGRDSFCTGSLIAPNLVLTAGHCMFDKATGERISAGDIEFLAGWRNGRAAAYRGVRRIIVHPEFKFTNDDVVGRVASDLALVELDQPIRNNTMTPYQTKASPRKGADVGVVSYAQGRSEKPSLQEMCKVLAHRSGALVMSCDVDYGSSGAPVFVLEGGVARIVSVVSAKAMAGSVPVSLGTSLEEPLSELLAIMAQNDGVFSRPQPAVRVLSLQDAQSATGAKFVRP